MHDDTCYTDYASAVDWLLGQSDCLSLQRDIRTAYLNGASFSQITEHYVQLARSQAVVVLRLDMHAAIETIATELCAVHYPQRDDGAVQSLSAYATPQAQLDLPS